MLMALWALTHVSAHRAQANLSAGDLLGVTVVLSALGLIHRPTIKALLTLSVSQILSILVDAPHHPDHWLLLFFVNVIVLGAAWKVGKEDGRIVPDRLMAMLTPGARLVFLICYGCAALSKRNMDFLFSEQSVARELFQHQVRQLPILSWLVWPPADSWITLACESAIPLLLLFSRTRSLGFVVGFVFHAARMISPAIAVEDFTLVVYTMLYLFTPSAFDRQMREQFSRLSSEATSTARDLICLTTACAMIAVSLRFPMGTLPLKLAGLHWTAAMAIVVGISRLGWVGFFGKEPPTLKSLTAGQSIGRRSWLPHWGLPYAVLALAVVNGLCPDVGLTTQGALTLFSNLRTEAGEWHHLFLPTSLHRIDGDQGRLVCIVTTSAPVLERHHVQRGLLSTEFEVRRCLASNPTMSLTVERPHGDLVVDAAQDPVLSQPRDLGARKLLIFLPVSPDGEPFVST